MQTNKQDGEYEPQKNATRQFSKLYVVHSEAENYNIQTANTDLYSQEQRSNLEFASALCLPMNVVKKIFFFYGLRDNLHSYHFDFFLYLASSNSHVCRFSYMKTAC